MSYYCEDCNQEIGSESHYHCGRCHHPRPTSMIGHYCKFDDGSDGLICEPENLGKTRFNGRITVTEDDIYAEI